MRFDFRLPESPTELRVLCFQPLSRDMQQVLEQDILLEKGVDAVTVHRHTIHIRFAAHITHHREVEANVICVLRDHWLDAEIHLLEIGARSTL